MWGIRTLFSVLALCLATACSGAGEDIVTVGEEGVTTINDTAMNVAIGQMPLMELNETEKEGLLYMVEEEKLAGDVYFKLQERWNLPIFANIGQAEETHAASVRTLLARYGLEDPSKGPGVFENSDLQAIYDDLVSRGETSLKDALEVGATIEELDIVDLQKRMAQTDKPDITLVYSNLMRGSENHLRAFVSNLNRRGFEYNPVYISKEEYEEIIYKNV